MVGGGMKQIISEIIGRVVAFIPYANLFKSRVSVDASQADYEFWDRLRRGKQKTYRLGGLFAQPIIQHRTSWTLGQGFNADAGDERTNEALNAFIEQNMKTIIEWYKDAQGLGDSYLVVNADGSLTMVPPNQVEIITADLDYREVVAYKITTKLDKATITDTYYADRREVEIKITKSVNDMAALDGFEYIGNKTYQRVYPNFSGRIPVIHRPEGRGTNELYGHPVYDAMLNLFAEYDDVLYNSLEGVKTMSNPIPVLEGVDNPQAELNALKRGTDTYDDEDGVSQTQDIIDFADPGRGEIIATSGQFNMKGPAPFTADAWQMLKALFLLMLQHSNIPEWVWGGAVASSKASVDAQMPAFTRFVAWLRLSLASDLKDLCEVWLAVTALYTPGVIVSEVAISYPEMTDKDSNMTIAMVKLATDLGLITDETALRLLDLVDDVEDEIKAAREEAEENMPIDQRFDQMVADAVRDTPQVGSDPAVDVNANDPATGAMDEAA